MKRLIATHNGIFHADEITAIALLNIFSNDDIEVERVAHGTKDFSKFDLVIDIGKKFDGVKFFDHHQYRGGKSSAGLIFDYLNISHNYFKLVKFIELVDKNDTGEEKAKEFEYSSLIKCFNHENIKSKEQDEQFNSAVAFAMTVIKSLNKAHDDLETAKEVVAKSHYFCNNHHIIELERFTPHWTSFINGKITQDIKAVAWKDEDENNWKVKIVPKRVGSFELNAKPFKQDKNMSFVHSSGHFAIAKDKASLKKFLDEFKY